MALRSAVALFHFLCGMAASSPQVINAEFDSAPQIFDHRIATSKFRQRALRLSQRLGVAEEELQRMSAPAPTRADLRSAASLLSLQPVDADRVGNGIAVTEPMLESNGWTINVSEENRGSSVARQG